MACKNLFGGSAAAFLILLAAAAGTGVIGAYLRSDPLGLGLGIACGRVGFCDLLALFRCFYYLHPVQRTNGIIPYLRIHRIEHVNAFIAVLHGRVLTAHCSQANALTELIHGVDMIHPVPVNAPEQQYAFDLAHIAALGGKASFLIRIGFVRFGYHGIAQPLTGILPEDAFAGNEIEFIPELAADTAVIPRLLLGLGRTAEIYDGHSRSHKLFPHQ